MRTRKAIDELDDRTRELMDRVNDVLDAAADELMPASSEETALATQIDSATDSLDQRVTHIAVGGMRLEGRVAHDGDPALARHVASAVIREKERGWRLDKPTKSGAPIDGAEAAALAVHFATITDPPRPRTHQVQVPRGYS
jgi:hypothetical protein